MTLCEEQSTENGAVRPTGVLGGGEFYYLSRPEGLQEGRSWGGRQSLGEEYAWGERELTWADSRGGMAQKKAFISMP